MIRSKNQGVKLSSWYHFNDGDHSQGSMKFEFQLANVLQPNSSKKTVVFAILEAKDTQNNLRAATSNYKEQLEDLLSTTWQ